MTNEQILELAKTCGFDRHICKITNDIYWECDEEDLLKFAMKCHSLDDGHFTDLEGRTHAVEVLKPVFENGEMVKGCTLAEVRKNASEIV